MCRVSVLTPVYNVEKYLPECMDSLLAQSLTDIEFICINDGSTDGSLAILQEYAAKDARIKIIDQPNGGYGKAMNSGLRTASGEYIGIVESDDFIDVRMFESLYRVAHEYQAEIVKSDFWGVTKEKTKKMENLSEVLFYKDLVPRMDGKKIFFKTPSIWSAIYKRDFLEEHHVVFHETPGASYQDVSFFVVTMACAQRAVFLPEAYLHYRMDNVNSSVHSKAKVRCIFDEFAQIHHFLAAYPSICEDVKYVIEGMKGLHYFANYMRIGDEYKKMFLTLAADEFVQDKEEGLLNPQFWRTADWNFLQRLLDNREKVFFEEYARLQKERMYLRGFLSELRDKKQIFVYGAGQVGHFVLSYLLSQQVTISGVLVSSAEKNPSMVLGIPVSVISDANVDPAQSTILVAVQEMTQYEIISSLQDKGFRHCIAMVLELRRAMM